MARLLREAAALTKQPTLKSFLEKRADAFVSNDYYASDVAWMELDASIEPTIGPYEVYEDEWFNFKAAFEAFITLTDARRLDEARALQQRAAGPGEPPADRAAVPPRQARRLLADPRRQRRVRRRRRQPRRADGRVQPAERRARRRGEGLQARAAARTSSRRSSRRCWCRSRNRRSQPADQPARRVRLVLHAHPDARADARTRAADHQGRRARDDRAAGAERAERPAGGSEGGHLRAVGACST